MLKVDIMPPLTESLNQAGPIVLVLGFFDGVHRGHQQVIAAGRAEAKRRGLPLALATFDKHPAIVYGHADEKTFTYLSDRDRQAELVAQFGVDIFYTIHFTPEFARLDPQSFVDQYIVGLNVAAVVAGFDYTYGPKEVATMPRLPRYAQNRFDVVTVPEYTDAGLKVSSTRVRAELAHANVDLVNQLLGYTYETTGTVVHGQALGRQLGFPTANVATTPGQKLPGIGIYVTQLLVQGRWVNGMTSVGRNVTVGAGRAITVESNLFDFTRDIYGKSVTVRWLHYLRGEEKFADLDALVEQLHQDERDSRVFLAAYTPSDV